MSRLVTPVVRQAFSQMDIHMDFITFSWNTLKPVFKGHCDDTTPCDQMLSYSVP